MSEATGSLHVASSPCQIMLMPLPGPCSGTSSSEERGQVGSGCSLCYFCAL
ncbi:hypothetical protein B4114_2875 [Geobacillus stearothermophilus]|uniref:Uncharacterized protein n=1 Tax=Geobacillus stearothermophilus TaxID=1422 RepID=A0A150NCM6_GEOSE|nr:hypothetical protein B4114_2875 [Geobacillus stearothermophilus]